jgi:hypothetical protein
VILFVSGGGDGVALARRIHQEGYPIVLFIQSWWSREKKHFEGLVPQVPALADAVALKPEVVIFDSTGMGQIAEETFKFTPCFGAARICDILEEDRGFGKEIMVRHGIRIPLTFIFNPADRRGLPWKANAKAAEIGKTSLHWVAGHLGEAKQIVAALKGRWVLKPYFAESSAETFSAHSPEEMLEHLDDCREKNTIPPDKPFMLERFIQGVEISTEVWIERGEVIPGSLNGMMETKRFLAGDLGSATGAQTSVVWPYQSAMPRIFRETFGTDPFLNWLRHPTGPDGRPFRPYSGAFEMNSIIAEEDHLPYGLEWGPRNGYNAIYAWAELLHRPLGEVFRLLALGQLGSITLRPGYGYVIQVSIPPFPGAEELNKTKDFGFVYRRVMELATGIDIGGPVDSPHIWLLDAKIAQDGNLESAGVDGIVCNVSGHGLTIEQARDPAHALVEALEIEDKQARIADGADRGIRDSARLEAWNYPIQAEARQAVVVS